MLSYLDTVARLTTLRDDLREVLNSETRDRQYNLEQTEITLTKLLGELVTPDPTPQTITIDFALILSPPLAAVEFGHGSL